MLRIVKLLRSEVPVGVSDILHFTLCEAQYFTAASRCFTWQSQTSLNVEQQYKYIDGIPCITFEVSYENRNYKGCDTFTLFDHFYVSKICEIEKIYRSTNGSFHIDDIGADTDGYIDFTMKNGLVSIKGQLGASFSLYSLHFEFEADQTLVGALLQALMI